MIFSDLLANYVVRKENLNEGKNTLYSDDSYPLIPFASRFFLKPLREFSINKETKLDCSKMSDEEVASLCVEEVCGPPSKHPVILRSDNIHLYNTDETQKEISETVKKITKKEKEIEDYVQYLKEQKERLDKLTPQDISDREAEELLLVIVENIKKRHKKVQSVFSVRPVKKDKVNLLIGLNSPYYRIYKDVISEIDVQANLAFA